MFDESLAHPLDRDDLPEIPPSGPLPVRILGETGLEVTPLCFGTGPLGNVAGGETYGFETDDERAHATLLAVLDSGVNYLDTAAMYGDGLAEQRVGRAIAEHGGLPDGFVVATKVNLDPATGDFSADQVRRSVERSLELLGLERLPLVYLHDPYRISFEQGTGPDGTLDGLLAVRDEGLVEHLGIAEGGVELAHRYLATGVFEAMITHNRWTLVDRSAGELIEEAVERDVGVSNAAVFGGGIMVRGVEASGARYAYHAASDALLDSIGAMERACADHDVPLPAAALNFSLRDPRITSTIVGVSAPHEVGDALAWARTPIPDELWDELDELLPSAEHWQH